VSIHRHSRLHLESIEGGPFCKFAASSYLPIDQIQKSLAGGATNRGAGSWLKRHGKRYAGRLAGAVLKPLGIAAAIGIPAVIGYKALTGKRTPMRATRMRALRQQTAASGNPLANRLL
jgi:hypothetical protein